MTEFALKIVTPDGLQFDGMAEELVVRTTEGDLGILAGHTNCVAALGMGRATVVTGGEKRYAACIGGMVSVLEGQVHLVATTFEWGENIDLERAARSEQRAQTVLEDKSASGVEIDLARARLRRALVRKSTAEICIK